MILFSFDQYASLSGHLRMLPFLQEGVFEVKRYPNGEMHIALSTSVVNQTCVILGGIAPPDEHCMAFMLLAHTLKKEGARSIIAVIPYLAYSRHDKKKPGESLAVAWIGALAKASGIDEVLTVDLHSERDSELFPIPLHSLSPIPLFAERVAVLGLTSAVLVAPDSGAIPRCEALRREARIVSGISTSTTYFMKRRTEYGVEHGGPIGPVGARVLVVDDILDTGETLQLACEKLQAHGAEEIYIMVTHGLFTGDGWRSLWEYGVKGIMCTDSVPRPVAFEDARITILSVGPLVSDALYIRQ